MTSLLPRRRTLWIIFLLAPATITMTVFVVWPLPSALRLSFYSFNGLKAAGFPADPQVHEAFTKYRKTHNDGVFDAYTPEIMKCRRSGIITGLPDAYGRGRIIGDYRRVALYGVDRLIEGKRAERAQIDDMWPNDEIIRMLLAVLLRRLTAGQVGG